MGRYAIKSGGAATGEIRKLPRPAQKRVVACIEKLASEPRPPGVEKLSQHPGFWRVREGDYRIVYWIDDGKNLVVVLLVRHRKDAYRNLDQLDAKLAAAKGDRPRRR